MPGGFNFGLQPANNLERSFNGNLATEDNGIVAASYYTLRGPEPPHILVPPTTLENAIVAPTFNGVGGDELTQADLRIITQTDFQPVDNSTLWKYEYRRNAQKILPFLYLGPWEVLKTQREFLRSEGISLLLVIRDRTTANAGIMNPKKCAEELGILYDSIDVQDNQELITILPRAVKLINDHLINCYRQQVYAAGNNFVPGQSPFRIGKVFVFCESGNDRSAVIAAAYLLAMYNLSLVSALQFIQAQRFCVAFDEPMKNLLKSYEDILGAQRDVLAARRQMREAHAQSAPLPLRQMDLNMNAASTSGMKRARNRDDSMDDARFEGRSTFQPFLSN